VLILAFSDLHRDLRAARELAHRAREVDVVVAAGDFGWFGRAVGRTLEELRVIRQPLILVPGNHESEEKLRSECHGWSNATVLHGEAIEIEGVPFFGLGGATPPTPFPWGFDLTEEEAASKLAGCPDGAVLISHSPPKGHLDRALGRELGCESVSEAITRTNP
jgi:Icc-related predicted phosphoesterase